MANETPTQVYERIARKKKAGQPITEADTADLTFAQYEESNASSRHSRFADAYSKLHAREWRRYSVIKQYLSGKMQAGHQDVQNTQNPLAKVVNLGLHGIYDTLYMTARFLNWSGHKLTAGKYKDLMIKYQEALHVTPADLRKADGVRISQRALRNALTPKQG